MQPGFGRLAARTQRVGGSGLMTTPDETVEVLRKQAKKMQQPGAGKHWELLNRSPSWPATTLDTASFADRRLDVAR